MEIALLPKNAVKVKGKHATVIVNPVDDSTDYQAALFTQHSGKSKDDAVAISGPGEYEVGGIKISGIKGSAGTVYSVTVDDLDILVGDLSVLEKAQHKLKEHHMVLILTVEERDASFVTSLATNALLLYGDKAKEVIEKFAKEGMTQTGKYQVTKEKLPTEIQTILLQ
jgi:hypothetical protein